MIGAGVYVVVMVWRRSKFPSDCSLREGMDWAWISRISQREVSVLSCERHSCTVVCLWLTTHESN